MSAILSADDLNDFISPGVACIKPIETLPAQKPNDSNPYEVTTEDKVEESKAPPAQISLTDCLACSGCVTSAEAVLVSLQSHTEVLDTLDRYRSIDPRTLLSTATNDEQDGVRQVLEDGKIFVASISPQTRASLAATYNVTEKAAGHMIEQLLSGPQGLKAGGQHGSHFAYVIDTNISRELCLVAGADEVLSCQDGQSHKKPVLTSACPGWICYAEKTHPHILPHLSRLRSPQAITGTFVKSVLSKKLNIPPSKIWHLALMPCFDKKLEASRAELTDIYWRSQAGERGDGVRDVDCVITPREILTLAANRGISFPSMPRTALPGSARIPFPDKLLDKFLFPPPRWRVKKPHPDAGPSGGYLWHVLSTARARNPGSRITISRGRNTDVVEYSLVGGDGRIIMKAARYYGFRNIQNLVRRLKPARPSRLPGGKLGGGGCRKPGAATDKGGGGGVETYDYVEVMACPGGCTNGGGQIKIGDLSHEDVRGSGVENGGSQDVKAEQKVWLRRVDSAYFSADSETDVDELDDDVEMDVDENGTDTINGISISKVENIVRRWEEVMDLDRSKLLYTTFREVVSDVGKSKGSIGDMERVAGLASSIGGGW